MDYWLRRNVKTTIPGNAVVIEGKFPIIHVHVIALYFQHTASTQFSQEWVCRNVVVNQIQHTALKLTR